MTLRTAVLSAMLILGAGIVMAATPTSTPTPTATPTPAPTSVVSGIQMTTAQHTFIQNQIIPDINGAKCQKYGQPTNCASLPGCLDVPFQVVTQTLLVWNSCTIYTQNAAGEGALARDALYEKLQNWISTHGLGDATTSCQAWQALGDASGNNTTAQDAVCTSLGRPLGCRVC